MTSCVFILHCCTQSLPFLFLKPYYMSPEIRRSRTPFDAHAVDVWALGPLLFLMVTGFPPFEIADDRDERYQFFSDGYFEQIVRGWNLGLSSNLLDLLQRMFFKNPRIRLSLEQVRQHPWMQGEEQLPPPLLTPVANSQER